MPSSAGIINRQRHFLMVSDNLLQWKGRHQKLNDWQRRKKLPLALLNSIIQKTLKQISKKLILLSRFQFYIFQHLYNLFQYHRILVKKILIMYVQECKVAVRIELKLPEIFKHFISSGIRVFFKQVKRVAYFFLVDISNLFPQKFLHSFFI